MQGKIPETMETTLKQARELCGYTQSEAAKKIGVSPDRLEITKGEKVIRIFQC